ncbi:MAG TPA: (d)CMP kinase [Bacteroidota bacterium]|nr:(d)CMP kinase [Bacteroidota bacterium]
MKKLVIAIDGPAASGKSTTARLVAGRLGYLHVDTGAMYRAMTYKVLAAGIDPGETGRVADLARETGITISETDGKAEVFLDGVDVGGRIRTPEVTRAVSQVSSVAAVRELMVREQRRLAATGGVVLEGRDIGTVVLPDADVKIFLVADETERARRRQRELREKDVEVTLDDLLGEIHERDRKDSSRDLSPLRRSEDAVEVDTSGLTVEGQVERILEIVRVTLNRREHDARG